MLRFKIGQREGGEKNGQTDKPTNKLTYSGVQIVFNKGKVIAVKYILHTTVNENFPPLLLITTYS